MDVGRVHSFEASCVVPDDPGEIVRGARPMTAEDASRLREQTITRLLAQANSPGSVATWRAHDERVRLAMKGWRSGS